MHTLLIDKDNLIITTVSERIVQRSKLANTIRILATNEHNGMRMNECAAIMFYRLPVSGEWKSRELTPSSELYKEKFVEYQFPADTWLTTERGDVQFEVRFYNVSMTGTLDIEQYVRKATGGMIHISSSEDWASGIADGLLDTFDQRLIQIMMSQNRQNEMMAEMQMNCPESLKVENGKLFMVNADGTKKGSEVDIVLPRVPDTEDGYDDGLIELDRIVVNDEQDDGEDGNFSEL